MAPVFLLAASSLYGAVARRRRVWYTRVPERQRRLSRPVISVGNLTVGGSGKTPVVEHLARLLLAAGEQPAILSRGYGRRRSDSGVTVVSDREHVRADLDHAGDEPLMLAQSLPGVPVLVARERYRAGRLAESTLGATVHLLDDGFQHVQLWRDVNLLVVHEDDLSEHVLPAGRLREPLSAAAAADAVLATTAGGVDTAAPGPLTAIRERLKTQTLFTVRRRRGPVRMLSSGTIVEPATVGRVFAVTGIARPERMFADLAAGGWVLSGRLTYRDHHRFTQSDIARIAAAARDAQSHVIVTTTKDAVRLADLDCSSLALAVAPIACTIEPAAAFHDWLMPRLAAARALRAGGPDRVETARS